MNDRVQRLISTERKMPPERASNTPAVRRGSTPFRRAFVNGAVSTNAIQSCYLDEDGVGDPVNVYCSVMGGSNLSEAIPRLADGEWIYVTYDSVYSRWRCISPFQATEDCE